MQASLAPSNYDNYEKQQTLFVTPDGQKYYGPGVAVGRIALCMEPAISFVGFRCFQALQLLLLYHLLIFVMLHDHQLLCSVASHTSIRFCAFAPLHLDIEGFYSELCFFLPGSNSCCGSRSMRRK